MHFLEFWWSQKYHQMNGHPQFSWKLHLKSFSTAKIKCTWILCRMDGGHLVFDLSRSSEIKSIFPQLLKIIHMVRTNYVRSFMLFSKSAWFSSYPALLSEVSSIFSRSGNVQVPLHIEPDLSPQDRRINAALMKERLTVLRSGMKWKDVKVRGFHLLVWNKVCVQFQSESVVRVEKVA